MKNDQDKRVSVSISFGDGGTIYGCGHALDTMLYAHDLSTEQDTFEWISDRESEMIDQVLKDYDWETYTLERLNLLPTVSEEYLHGDYLRFEEPERFAQYVKEDRKCASDLVNESIGDWTSPSIPSDLVKDLERGRDYLADEAQREWLNGDRSNPGALKQLATALFGRCSDADASWEPKSDIVTLEASGEDWREWLSYDLDEREPLPSAQELGEKVKAWILTKAQSNKEQHQKRSEARAADYKRREEMRQAELEREKEEARKRKAQKKQA